MLWFDVDAEATATGTVEEILDQIDLFPMKEKEATWFFQVGQKTIQINIRISFERKRVSVSTRAVHIKSVDIPHRVQEKVKRLGKREWVEIPQSSWPSLQQMKEEVKEILVEYFDEECILYEEAALHTEEQQKEFDRLQDQAHCEWRASLRLGVDDDDFIPRLI